jgi:hypothetical protein
VIHIGGAMTYTLPILPVLLWRTDLLADIH